MSAGGLLHFDLNKAPDRRLNAQFVQFRGSRCKIILSRFFANFSLHDIFCRTVYIPVMRCTLRRLADIMANPQEMINLLMRKYLSFLWQKYVSLHWLVLCTCRSKVQIWIIFKERFMVRRNLPMRIYLTRTLFRCASISSNYPCLSVRPSVRRSVGHTFGFPICQRLWSPYVKSWRERTPIIFQFWVWMFLTQFFLDSKTFLT